MLIIGSDEVRRVLQGSERRVLEIVRDAYRLHDEGRSVVPHSAFLRFPDDPGNRIIALPAFLGGERAVAGMKWVASFPGNLANGLDRASAAILLNSLHNGRPEVLVEGSMISAKRTAASAALAADLLLDGAPASGVTFVGCGVTNREVLRFLVAALPDLSAVTAYDQDLGRAAVFATYCEQLVPGARVEVAQDAREALAAQDVVSFATTAGQPHVDLTHCRPGAVVLHVSLRDIYPDSILANQNIVDDADHVCRERTSLHLAEMLTYGRKFIDASIGQLIRRTVRFRRDPNRVVVFSPFGLGMLDMALAGFVRETAVEMGLGTTVDRFLPEPTMAGSGPRDNHNPARSLDG